MRVIGVAMILFGSVGALICLFVLQNGDGDTVRYGMIADREVGVIFWGLLALGGWVALGAASIERAIARLPGYRAQVVQGLTAKPFHDAILGAAGVKSKPAEDGV